MTAKTDPLGYVMDSFPFITAEHVFYPHVQGFKAQCRADACLREALARIGGLGAPEVRISLRGRFAPDGSGQFRGVLLSFQLRAPFHAVTLSYSSKTDRLVHYEFPQDPTLGTLAEYFRGQAGDVLRYIPRQRLTFRAYGPGGEALIGKFVRPSELAACYGRLSKVFRAAGAARSFSVAAPAGTQDARSIFFQHARPGTDLAVLLDQDNCLGLLSTLGEIHRELHRLEVPDLPQLDLEAFHQELATSIGWIACFRPDQRPLLEEVRDALFRHAVPVDPGQYVFCHGDWSCPQVLKDDGRWSVVDFDRCLRGDPYLEVAKLISFMKYNVPVLRDWFLRGADGRIEEAAEAYLHGYETAAQQRLDRKRLLWYRMCFEIHYLARVFKRDLFDRGSFDRGLELLRKLSGEFSR